MALSNVRSPLHAEVVKLVDTLASGASARKGVEVQVLSSAPLYLSDKTQSAPHLTAIHGPIGQLSRFFQQRPTS